MVAYRIGDVVVDRHRERHGLLGHHADVAAQAVHRVAGGQDVLAVSSTSPRACCLGYIALCGEHPQDVVDKAHGGAQVRMPGELRQPDAGHQADRRTDQQYDARHQRAAIKRVASPPSVPDGAHANAAAFICSPSVERVLPTLV